MEYWMSNLNRFYYTIFLSLRKVHIYIAIVFRHEAWRTWSHRLPRFHPQPQVVYFTNYFCTCCWLIFLIFLSAENCSDDEDLKEGEALEFEEGFENIVVLDDLPVVPPQKFETRTEDPETRKSLGFCFIHYNTPQVINLFGLFSLHSFDDRIFNFCSVDTKLLKCCKKKGSRANSLAKTHMRIDENTNLFC